jgi:hypothetical protein
MTENQVQELFAKHEAEDSLRFSDVTRPRARRPDLHALLLLDSLFPGEGNLIDDAEFDKVYFYWNMELFCQKGTEEDIKELVACGMSLNEYNRLVSYY